ncbi:MAG: hypothetical protein ACR2N3_04735 [Pyrinomonadaceae bacterium]
MNIHQFVREQRQNYETKRVKIARNYNYNQKDTLDLIELYYNSKFLSGNLDSLEREKPFFNINKFRVNVATRTTDMDVKDIKIESETSDDYVRSFLLTKENMVWMKQANFSRFLNDLGKTRAKYGGTLIKKTNHNGELKLTVVPWKDLITDQTDILKGVIIERHFYTPAELKAMSGVWDNVDEAIETARANKDDYNETNSKQTPGDYIEVYEIHGDLPVAMLKDIEDVKEEDFETYSTQVHIVCGSDMYDTDDNGKKTEKGTTLFSGKEKQLPYKYLAWDEVPGRALGVGVVEDSFEAQVWTNDLIYKEKEIVELASKIIYQTTDKTVGKNVLTDLENGDIITLKDGKTLSQVNNVPSSLPEFTNMLAKWKDQLDRTTNTYEANTGENLPSGTPYRLGATLNQEANSMFDYRREEMGIFLQEVYEDWVMPYLIKKLKSKHTLATEFSEDELNMIDSAHIELALKEEIEKKQQEGILITDIEQERQRLKQKMMQTKATRFINVPKNYYDDINATISIITTNETRVKAAVLETLNSVLVQFAQNPQILDNPVTKKILNKIMEVSGAFSPIELQVESATPLQTNQPNQPMQPPSGLPQQAIPQQQAIPAQA